MKILLPILLVLAACGGDDKFTVEKLQDPETCKDCHPKHFQQWSGSMHAYASDDPVFVAMNKRGQRDTNNELGPFCVQCHAPMAVKLGLTNGADFDPAALTPATRGITCFFCHNVDKITDDHNNGLQLAMDQTMRGGVNDASDTPAHNSLYDTKMDSATNKSQMCGSCHDVVTPRGVALERTYSEWQTTIFSHDDPMHHLPLTCSGCHMQSSSEPIADKPGLDVKSRPDGFHEHMWPAIDQALTPFAEADAQATAIKRDLDPALTIVGPRPAGGGASPGGICLRPDAVLTVRMDTIGTGHFFPSGAAQDRRAWLEVKAYDVNNQLLFSSGVVPDGMDPEDISDPNLVGFWDRTTKDDGTQAHFFWDVANVDSTKLLKPPVTLEPTDPAYDHSTTSMFTVGAVASQIDRIEARVRTRPLAFSILDQLVTSGDLAPSVASQMKTLDSVGATRTWTRATMNPISRCNPF